MGKRPGNKAAGPGNKAAGPGNKATGPAARAGAERPRGNVKKKTNSKPEDLDTQEIPFKLREIMRSRMEMNKPKKKRKQARKPRPQNEGLQTDIPVPKFKRERNETVGAYLNRMNRETQHVLFLTKNQLERQPEMELDDKGELPKKEEVEVPKKQKSEKRKKFDRKCLDKFVRRKEEKKVARLEEEMFKDEVMFGEVVMEPPVLTVRPRKGPAEKKAGEKQLFLTKFFDKGSAMSNPPPMSMARKRIVEEERERVVNAYRELKKRRLQQAAASKPSRSPHT